MMSWNVSVQAGGSAVSTGCGRARGGQAAMSAWG